MLFNSYVFILIFLPLVLSVYYVLGGQERYKTAISWLIASSLFFYAWWNPAYLGLLLVSMFFNYGIGRAIGNIEQRKRKPLLIAGVTLNLALIGYYKYANFFVTNMNSLFSMEWQLDTIILPLAISFFTFQQIAYLVDVYRNEAREYNFLHYCLFVTFFPQLIAGPIVHHKEMLPQFEKKSTFKFNYDFLALGITIFSFGLFKKVVFADSIAVYASPVFSAADQGVMVTFFEAWGGLLAYTFQLYFDFSGYSDMAIGLALLFGIYLPINFNSPYKAVNIADFWRRWHITLSRFLRDYVYIALGGNRYGKFQQYNNLMITMLLGGLWHGAGWTFIFWGALHGFYLMVNHAWQALRISWGHELTQSSVCGRFVSRVITFVAVIFAWVFFRATTLDGAVNMLKGMTGLNGLVLDVRLASYLPFLDGKITFEGLQAGSFHLWGVPWILLLGIITWWMPNVPQLVQYAGTKPEEDNKGAPLSSSKTSFVIWKPSLAWAILTLGIFLYSLNNMSKLSEFLYFQF